MPDERWVLSQKGCTGGRKRPLTWAPNRVDSASGEKLWHRESREGQNASQHGATEGHSCRPCSGPGGRQLSEPTRAPPAPPPLPRGAAGMLPGRGARGRNAAAEIERTWLKHIEIALSGCFTSQSNGSHGNSVHDNASGPDPGLGSAFLRRPLAHRDDSSSLTASAPCCRSV